MKCNCLFGYEDGDGVQRIHPFPIKICDVHKVWLESVKALERERYCRMLENVAKLVRQEKQ